MEVRTATAADVDCTKAVGTVTDLGLGRTSYVVAREAVSCTSSNNLMNSNNTESKVSK